jgi:hypothetical protein
MQIIDWLVKYSSARDDASAMIEYIFLCMEPNKFECELRKQRSSLSYEVKRALELAVIFFTTVNER